MRVLRAPEMEHYRAKRTSEKEEKIKTPQRLPVGKPLRDLRKTVIETKGGVTKNQRTVPT